MVAGGGTAGHVLPGIAVARELVARGLDPSEIHFVGSQRGPEGELVESAGFAASLLPGRGIQRRLTLENLGAALGLVVAFGRALTLVRRSRPRVVLVLGGYAALACALAAVIWRVPLVVADQNARAGAVNRIAGRFAVACAVPFDSTDLPHKVVTGNPVRSEVVERAARRDPRGARSELAVPDRKVVVAVFAGSLGADRINAAVGEAVQGEWSSRPELAVYHVLGARGWDAASRDGRVLERAGTSGAWYRAVRYEQRMALLLDAADIVVCRAGGTTVAELAVMGTPSLLVPLPIATRDHQSANAAELVDAGAAVCVPDGEFDATRLVSEVDRLLRGAGTLSEMASAAARSGRPDAASAVADLVLANAR